MTQEELLEKIETSGDLPTLPAVITSVLQLIRDPKTSASDIGKAISGDMALSAKILKIVNSAFYGFQRKISTITQSIVILGFNNIKAAVLGVSIVKAFDDISDETKAIFFNREDFWKHAVGCAAAARSVARHINFDQAEECFIAGMLLDVGKLILDQFATDIFKKALRYSRDEQISLERAERQIIGFSHSQLGAYITNKWNFPENLTQAVLHHTNPTAVKAEEEIQKLVAVVHFGRILSKALNIGNDGEAVMPRLNKEAWFLLKINEADLETIMESTLEEYQKSLGFINVA
jgi:HD-like signal output (HDOD) protein